MTFSSTATSSNTDIGKRAIQQNPLPQSRELGDALPEQGQDVYKIAGKAKPEAKSWAHFVAGG